MATSSRPPFEPTEIILTDGGDSAETNLRVKQLCTRLLPGWSDLSPDTLDVTPICGGISNLLVKVSPAAQHGLPPVAFKVFGNKTELLVDREQEIETLITLNQHGFGAKVVGLFSNGRIEEFLTAITLTPEQMSHPAYVQQIAATLRRLHAVPTDGKPLLWSTIMRWFEMASQLSFDDPVKQEQFAKVQLSALKQEIEETKALCDSVASPVVFSHNDLLSGNILIVQGSSGAGKEAEAAEAAAPDAGAAGALSSGHMTFIDYEYSVCGYRGFDLANHFNEYAGFECDYSRYPSSEQMHLFFRHYLTAGGAAGAAAAAPSASELAALQAEAHLFSLASHIYWGVWSLLQARHSPIDFDYLTYSTTRWAEYFRRKEEFVAEARAVLLGDPERA